MQTVSDQKALKEEIISALQTCFDPEIPVDIYQLGLIYDVAVDPLGEITVTMTLTSPHCPAAQSLPEEVQGKIRALPGVAEVHVDIVWDPPWDPSRMSEAAKLQLGML